MPSSYLEGKVVWITGASSGLGEQLALSAAAGGAEGIILSGRRIAELERVKRACEKARPDKFSSVGGVRVLPFDVGDLEFVEKEAAPRAMREFGRLDTLVLNAGVSAGTYNPSYFQKATPRHVLHREKHPFFQVFRTPPPDIAPCFSYQLPSEGFDTRQRGSDIFRGGQASHGSELLRRDGPREGLVGGSCEAPGWGGGGERKSRAA